jgi:hypothetical protein
MRDHQADDDRVIAGFDELDMPVNLGQPFWVICRESNLTFLNGNALVQARSGGPSRCPAA